MKHHHIDMAPAELRRLRKIANGNTRAENTPAEDALFKKHLIQESMLILDSGDGTYEADIRGVLLTEQGELYWSQYLKERKETFRFWIATTLAFLSVIVSVIALVQ